MKLSYNILQKEFNSKLPEPDELSEFFTMRMFEIDDTEKVGDDIIYDIKILPDRGPDLLSYYGVCRELSCYLNIPLKNSLKNTIEKEKQTGRFLIEVPENDLCKTMYFLECKKPNEIVLPFEIKELLDSVSQKSISPEVDITNYMLYRFGQPTHVYDGEKLENSISIRKGNGIEELVTLHGEPLICSESDIIIAQKSGVLALAGIKGGKLAEVSDTTKTFVFEMGIFDSITIRKSLKSHGMITEAGKRYVHAMSPRLPDYIISELASLLEDIGFTDISLSSHRTEEKEQSITCSLSKINSLLSLSISIDHLTEILHTLSFSVVRKSSDELEITPPWYRTDCDNWQCIAEEIGKYIGYDTVESKPLSVSSDLVIGNYLERFSLKNFIASYGFDELITYSFVKAGEVEVLYPVSKHKGFLRKDLEELFLESFEKNSAHKDVCGVVNLSFFEMGSVFKKSGEEEHLIIATENGKTFENFIEELILFAKTKGIILFEIKKSLSKKKSFIEFKVSYEKRDYRETEIYQDIYEKSKPWSLFPSITRDISLFGVLGETEKIANLIKENLTELCVTGPRLLDVFEKEGKTSYLFRLVFQSFDKTLSDEDIKEDVEKIYQALTSAGYSIR